MGLVERLRMLLGLGELSQRRLAALAGLSSSHVSLILNRGGSCDVKTAESIAHVFDVSLDWLVSGTGRRPSKDDVVRAIARAEAHHAKSAPTGTAG